MKESPVLQRSVTTLHLDLLTLIQTYRITKILTYKRILLIQPSQTEVHKLKICMEASSSKKHSSPDCSLEKDSETIIGSILTPGLTILKLHFTLKV